MTARWVRRLAPYLIVGAIVLALALAVRAAWRGHYQAGRRDALAQAAAVAAQQRDTVRITIARTDTVVRTYTRQVGHAQETADRIHDTVRVLFPTVDTLVREVDALADSLPVLLGVVQTERVAHQSLALSLSLVTVAKTDTIRTLRRRPTRTRAALLMLATGLAAYAAGAR